MATKKDLTEAYAFSRRRLVTAFVSGAPGGREVEPTRPGRTIIGGLALAVLLVAGAAVAGVFSPRVDEGWADQPGLIISKESGAAYVITDVEEGEEPVLRPVINITSAKLILGPDVEPTIIPDEYINQEQRGDDIGILGAPANVPDQARLVESGWTACTDLGEGGGIRVAVSEEPEVAVVDNGGLLVAVDEGRGGRGERPQGRAGQDGDGAVYVIGIGRADGSEVPRAYSYRVPDSRGRDNLLDAVGLPQASGASPVPEEWLALFPRGGDLTRDAFQLEGQGDPATYATGLAGLEEALIGDVVSTPGETLLLTQDGPAVLDEFPAGVYLAGDEPDIVLDEPPALDRADQLYLAANWPTGPVTPVLGQQCAQLSAVAGERPGVQIVRDPVGDASAEEVEAGDRSVVVDAGAGAYVLSGGWDQASGGEPHVLDAKGQRYPLVGAGTAGQLGYADYAAPTVPDPWVELFDRGVSLSPTAALCPPTLKAGKSCA